MEECKKAMLIREAILRHSNSRKQASTKKRKSDGYTTFIPDKNVLDNVQESPLSSPCKEITHSTTLPLVPSMYKRTSIAIDFCFGNVQSTAEVNDASVRQPKRGGQFSHDETSVDSRNQNLSPFIVISPEADRAASSEENEVDENQLPVQRKLSFNSINKGEENIGLKKTRKLYTPLPRKIVKSKKKVLEVRIKGEKKSNQVEPPTGQDEPAKFIPRLDSGEWADISTNNGDIINSAISNELQVGYNIAKKSSFISVETEGTEEAARRVTVNGLNKGNPDPLLNSLSPAVVLRDFIKERKVDTGKFLKKSNNPIAEQEKDANLIPDVVINELNNGGIINSAISNELQVGYNVAKKSSFISVETEGTEEAAQRVTVNGLNKGNPGPLPNSLSPVVVLCDFIKERKVDTGKFLKKSNNPIAEQEKDEKLVPDVVVNELISKPCLSKTEPVSKLPSDSCKKEKQLPDKSRVFPIREQTSNSATSPTSAETKPSKVHLDKMSIESSFLGIKAKKVKAKNPAKSNKGEFRQKLATLNECLTDVLRMSNKKQELKLKKLIKESQNILNFALKKESKRKVGRHLSKILTATKEKLEKIYGEDKSGRNKGLVIRTDLIKKKRTVPDSETTGPKKKRRKGDNFLKSGIDNEVTDERKEGGSLRGYRNG